MSDRTKNRVEDYGKKKIVIDAEIVVMLGYLQIL